MDVYVKLVCLETVHAEYRLINAGKRIAEAFGQFSLWGYFGTSKNLDFLRSEIIHSERL